MNNSSKYLNLALATIILLACLIRVYHIGQPLIEGVSGGQIERATIARNFYRTGDLLMPQIDTMPQPHPVYCEFPLYAWTVAMFYFVAGGIHEWIGRSLSIVFFMCAVLLFYKMVSMILNKKTGVIAVACLCFLPNSIMFSRSFSLDTMNLFFSIGMLLSFFLWLEKGKSGYFILSLILAILTYLTRIITIFMIVPMIYLAYAYWGRRFILNYRFWVYHIISLLPAAIWYRYAQLKMLDFYGEKYLGISTYYDLSYYIAPLKYLNYGSLKMLFEYVAGMTLTPVGFTLVLLGVLLRRHYRRENVFLAWLVAATASFFLYANKIPALNYYLFLIPPAAVYIGKFVLYLWEKEFQSHSYLKYALVKMLIFIFMVLMVFGYVNSGYKMPIFVQHLPEAAESVKKHTNPDNPIIWRGPTALLYYADRKGWRFECDRKRIERNMRSLGRKNISGVDSIAYLEMLRTLGASYFVTIYMEEFYREPELSKYVLSNYEVLDSKKDCYIIVDLRQKHS